MASYGYWPDGLAKGSSYPNGLREGRCYDAAGRLTTIVTAVGAIDETCGAAVPVVSRFVYEYDGDGNRTRQVEQRREPGASAPGPEELTTYGYDALDRVVGVQYPGGRAVLYRLDAVGNRTGERELTGVASGSDLTRFDPIPTGAALTRDVTASFNRADWVYARTDAVDATQSATFGYDAAGNLILKQKGTLTRRLRWSSRDTLTAVVDNGVEVGRYDYDGDLQRVKRKTAQEDVEYVLDDRHVLQEASASSGHPAYRRYHYAHEPLAVDDGAGRRFISTDALGSTTDLTTTGATVASMRKYDAWGQYRNGTAPASSEPKLGFTGHQFDPETGLVYARARYYDAEIGIFISRDAYEGELEDGPSLHRFAYAAVNPLRFWDATGFCTEGQDGCTLSLWDMARAAVESMTSDTTYQEARAKRLEENYRSSEAKKQEEEVEEAENGPSVWKRASRAVEEKLDKVKKWWDRTRAGQAVADADESLRDTATYMVGQALAPTVQAMADAKTRPADSAPQVLAQAQAMNRNLGDAAVDAGENGAINYAIGGIVRVGGLAAEARAARAEAKAIEKEVKALAVEEKTVAKLAAAERAATKEFIDPWDVRFTQSSISQSLSTGEDINDVVAALRGPRGDELAASFRPIRVFDRDGVLYTLDNRRLAIFSAAGRKIPVVRATAEEIAAEAWKSTATPEQQGGWFIRVKRGKGQL